MAIITKGTPAIIQTAVLDVWAGQEFPETCYPVIQNQ